MTIDIRDGITYITYRDIKDFFDNTDISKPPPDMHPGNKSEYSSVKSGDSSWRYDRDANHAGYIKNRFNPDIGRKMCEENLQKTLASEKYKELVKLAMTYKRKRKFHDVGNIINVPRAISGDPSYFVKHNTRTRPTAKIAINIAASCSVNSSQFAKLASVVVPVIYALEMAGIVTEVHYACFSMGSLTGAGKTQMDLVSVPIKSAQERFNWTNFAPVFSPGTFRESTFLSWIYSPYKTGWGLGRPMEGKEIDAFHHDYTAVIGFNAPGPDVVVNEIFSKLNLKP